jgi:hypothetical protein
MQSSSKRTVQVNVKMSVEDFALLKKAADDLWPDAVLTNSSIVLGLAKLGSNHKSKATGRSSLPGRWQDETARRGLK